MCIKGVPKAIKKQNTKIIFKKNFLKDLKKYT